MEIREATKSDVDAIRSIAETSLSSTYTDFLEAETIDDAVEQWYGDGFDDELEDDNSLVLVVERDGDVVAFSQSELVGQPHATGRLLWLHVDPDHRGDGTGVRLLVRTREKLLEESAEQVQGFVLEDNEGGNEFYRSHGFEQAGQREVEIGSETFTENVYAEGEIEGEGWGAIDELDVDGESVYVSYGEGARGSKSPFYSTYQTEDREERYAWLCGNCDSLDNAMDTMGRIECNVCGNRRKATRWDASYL
ncbi:GNAT family N-acetyltransferase [Natronobacterium texcoconense]|uniref:Ribosomal protein S18 acetylase RimI n=1 Tax=Natronobacterium texcoconense TaxID=1095778 RepID=A0A1H1B811_NATTX|nr:GNAT family N-acetyltransferase [Natronobacterium texcoconense]SDQ48022.1 Ribosomal protein S18 acetylase RimI [Natronobacterium texcoconense]